MKIELLCLLFFKCLQLLFHNKNMSFLQIELFSHSILCFLLVLKDQFLVFSHENHKDNNNPLGDELKGILLKLKAQISYQQFIFLSSL